MAKANHSIIANSNLKLKYQKLIREAMVLCDSKQYKKGLKNCALILKANPDNPEATSIKGLLLYSQGETQKGSSEIKRGLALNIKSSICWYIYALHHRATRNYKMAIKAFLNAVKIDEGNSMLLKDLSMLYLYLGDFANFKKYTFKSLSLESNQRERWIALLVASYLNKVSIETKLIYDTFIATLDSSKENPYEFSEIVLFGAKVCKEVEGNENYLEFLDSNEKFIVDKTFIALERAKTLLKLGKKKDCREMCLSMINQDPELSEAHQVLCESFGYDLRKQKSNSFSTPKHTTKLGKLQETYAITAEKHGKSLSVFSCRLKLENEPSKFQAILNDLLQTKSKDMNNVFLTIRDVAREQPKIDLIQAVVNKREEEARLDYEQKASAKNRQLLVGILIFQLSLALHLRVLEEIDRRIKALEKFENHYTLTLMGHAMKKLGKYEASLEYYQKSLKLASDDRLTNNNCVKALLKVNRKEDALKLFFKFSKPEERSLEFMKKADIIWVFDSLGKYHLAQGEHMEALRHFAVILKYFFDMPLEETDFHLYCFHKASIRVHLEMCSKTRDRFKRKLFVKTAKRVLACYLQLIESGKQTKEQNKLQLNNAARIAKILEHNAALDQRAMELASMVHLEKGNLFLAARFARLALETPGKTQNTQRVIRLVHNKICAEVASKMLQETEKVLLSCLLASFKTTTKSKLF